MGYRKMRSFACPNVACHAFAMVCKELAQHMQ